MILKNLQKFLKLNFFFLIILIAVTHYFNIYQNIYVIFKRNYEERMTMGYGYCERESYGFLKKAYELTGSNRLKVVNFEEHLWPPINGLFKVVNKTIDQRYIVLLNLKNFKNNTYISYLNERVFLKKENIILNETNCYVLKND
tara:strand:+ start:183 stop:611 length:429 start_codon:yes stop_codon:yes gene_type:complete